MRSAPAVPASLLALSLLALSPMALSACGSPDSSGLGGAAGPSTPASPAAPWLIDVTARPTTGATPPSGFRASPTPSWAPLPSATTCDIAWPTDEQVFIPMIVTPGARSLKVQWPSWYGPRYRVAAIDQRLVTGTQPPPTWVNVTAGTGCTVTATLTGLIPGNPYVVWLDAPDTPRGLDNSRSLYSGRSAVVKPF
jgi:hypothetical protein